MHQLNIPSVAERFWTKVNKDGPIHPVLQTPYWIWTAFKDSDGYGKLQIGRSAVGAHRVSYCLHNNVEITPEQLGMHNCDNPSCVNPLHLSLGTILDNRRDCVDKCRHARGTKMNTNILTIEQVYEAREWVPSNGETRAQLAKRLGVADVTIKKIRSRENWPHLPERDPVTKQLLSVPTNNKVLTNNS